MKESKKKRETKKRQYGRALIRVNIFLGIPLPKGKVRVPIGRSLGLWRMCRVVVFRLWAQLFYFVSLSWSYACLSWKIQHLDLEKLAFNLNINKRGSYVENKAPRWIRTSLRNFVDNFQVVRCTGLAPKETKRKIRPATGNLAESKVYFSRWYPCQWEVGRRQFHSD